MYAKDGISKDEVISLVDTFPNQGISALVYVLEVVFRTKLLIKQSLFFFQIIALK